MAMLMKQKGSDDDKQQLIDDEGTDSGMVLNPHQVSVVGGGVGGNALNTVLFMII